jgi:quinol monooxygenase YgiN
MIVLIANLRARTGRRADLVAALDAIRVDAADEPGTLVFAVHTARDDADVVVCYEAYRDDEAMATHREGGALGALMEHIGDLTDGPPVVTYVSLVGATGLTGA